LSILESGWKYKDCFILKGKRKLKLECHTQGWSGNEDIMEALIKNKWFWMAFWKKSERGGHYYFEINPIKDSKKLQERGVR
jgi:hypothetical protein